MLIWGAGATASLGIWTTRQQQQFFQELAPNGESSENRSLETRLRAALKNQEQEPWVSAFADLLLILGDPGRNRHDKASVTRITCEQVEAMARNWNDQEENELRRRIVELRRLYDWPALVDAINVCPGRRVGKLTLNDLFNLLDMHQQSGHGFREKDDDFISPQRIIGARGALKLLIQSLAYANWHVESRSAESSTDLQHHLDFAKELNRRMQRQGLRKGACAGRDEFEEERFIMGDVSVVSMNWDPIGLWAQFVANRNLNQAASVPHVGIPPRRLQIFHDLGHFVAGPRIRKNRPGSRVWQPMNLSSARQLNDRDSGADVCIRLSKFLFPHGCLWWRECPNCGKLSSYYGDEWAISSRTLLPPPPLRAFVDGIGFKSWCADSEENRERDAWLRGQVDARACIHCRTLTYADHAPLLMQSNLKAPPPPYIEEIQRDMRVVVQDADHIVLMGYSLPADDFTYRAFFAARTGRKSESKVRCSVVDRVDKPARPRGDRWYGPDELKGRANDLPLSVKNARDIFGPENVRLFAGGIPNVFLDGGSAVARHAVERLLTWDSTGL